MATDSAHAVVLEDVVKSFKKTARKREFTTLKTELVRMLSFQRKPVEPSTRIEALKGVSLSLKKGSTVGIIGRNGSGKSTLLKLLTGIYTPTSGRITMNGRISALLELGAGFHPDFTGRENILINGIILGMSRAEVKERAEEIIRFAEVGDFIDEPVRTYSSGMYMRLAFAVATHVEPDILIIDEILAVGDEHFQRKSQAKMNDFRAAGKTIILVTHGLGTVEEWCDEAAWLDGGRVRLFGDPKMVVGEYRRAVLAAEAESVLTGRSALSEPGLELPDVHRIAGNTPSGTVRVISLSANGISGTDPVVMAPESRLDASIGWQSEVALEAARFTIRIETQAGQAIFTSTHQAAIDMGSGAIDLTIPTLCLAPGRYELLASVVPPGDGLENPATCRVAFQVEGPVDTGSVVVMGHAWTPRQADPRTSESAVKSAHRASIPRRVG
jgi:lipopolysaccharide transport system ATP-binding protein